ncbi:hypothetical protein [Rhodococcus sp. 14-2470-1b]|uniref:hypothetical protein n=1 Tax=Rhodococcus sp. 14-2470-1b TaxID=2023149 RepID=UPI0015963B63|nr:hypothetical protein [Rhodococcus sp. 14-2470-1b]
MSDTPEGSDTENPPAKEEDPKPDTGKKPPPDSDWIKTEEIRKRYDGDEETKLEK